MFLRPIDDELSREIQKPVYISYPGLKASFQISEYLGQLAAYLRILDDKARKPHENQTISLILCKSADKEYVEYIIHDYDKPEKLRGLCLRWNILRNCYKSLCSILRPALRVEMV